MRYATAVSRLRKIAEGCDRPNRLWDEAVLLAAYAFGDVLSGVDDIPEVQVAFVLGLPPNEVTWMSEPPEGSGIASLLELEKASVQRFWRPAAWPV